MQKVILCILLFFLFSSILLGAFEDISPDAVKVAMGQTSSLSFFDLAMYHSNPAWLINLESSTVTMAYSDPFGIKELRLLNLTYASVGGKYPYQILISQFGNKIYSENQLNFGTAFRYSETVGFGISFNYYSAQIASYPNRTWLSLSFGIVLEIDQNVSVGVLHRNPLIVSMKSLERELPQILTAGLKIKMSQSSTVVLELNKDTAFPLTIRSGMMYRIFKGLWIGAGYETGISRFSCGLGIIMGKFGFNLAVQMPRDLPATICSSGSISL